MLLPLMQCLFHPQQLVQSRSVFGMTTPGDAAAFIFFTKEWREWLLKTYGPRIVKWLDLVWKATRPGTADSSLTEPSSSSDHT